MRDVLSWSFPIGQLFSIMIRVHFTLPLVFLGWRAGWLAAWPSWAVLVAGFGFFRLYDIAKPFGIARLQRWPGGWGIVVDDFAAALVACVSLHLTAWLWTWR